VTASGTRVVGLLLGWAPLWLLLAVGLVLGSLSPVFLTTSNVVNILVQSSSLAIVATGMTIVLLTAGVDLSVGSLMFVSAAVVGLLTRGDATLPVLVAAAVAAGVAGGLVNAGFVSRLGVPPFIVTLATLYVGRGFALWLTETRALNLPDTVLQLGTSRVAGVPVPVLVAVAVVGVAHLALTRTPWGRHVYAVGHDVESARRAGLPVRRLVASVYVVSGACAALGALVLLGQLGAVSPTFGQQREFAAIAAAVLGGTSLFGGRGAVFPGTVLGVVLIQTVENGLVLLNADPYFYPLVTSSIILLAVLVDSGRRDLLARMGRRRITVA
jgi:ribose transport system permease protein